MMKPVHDINLTKYSQDFLKIKSKARLSILILSKAYPTKGITQISFAEKQQRVGPYFQVLAFRF